MNNKKENYKFRFKHIFPQDCSQEDVFGVVAQPVIDSVIDGYNGTIFAYGQPWPSPSTLLLCVN